MHALYEPDAPGAPALFWVTAGVLAGQSAAAVAVGPWWRAAVGGAALVGLLLATWLRRRPAVGLALLAASFGHWQVDRLQRPDLPPDHVQRLAGARVVLRGRLAERPVWRPGKLRLTIEAEAVRLGSEWQPAQGGVLVTLRDATRPWRRGDGMEGIHAVRRPRNFGNPGEFDFAAYLARRGVYATAFAADDRSWRRTPAAPGWDAPIERW